MDSVFLHLYPFNCDIVMEFVSVSQITWQLLLVTVVIIGSGSRLHDYTSDYYIIFYLRLYMSVYHIVSVVMYQVLARSY